MKIDGRWAYATKHVHEPVSHGYCPDCADATKLEFFCEQASQVSFRRAGQVNDLLQQITA